MKPNSLGMAFEALPTPASAHLFSYISLPLPALAHPLACVPATQDSCPSLRALSLGFSMCHAILLQTAVLPEVTSSAKPLLKLSSSSAGSTPSEQFPCHYFLSSPLLWACLKAGIVSVFSTLSECLACGRSSVNIRINIWMDG